MNFICYIDKEIYKCITKDIITDEVIITDERIEHIKERHPQNYELYKDCLSEIIMNPDYILEANKPKTAFVLKSFDIKGTKFQLILRLSTTSDSRKYKNSVITFLEISEKKWEKYLRNKKILYSSENAKV